MTALLLLAALLAPPTYEEQRLALVLDAEKLVVLTVEEATGKRIAFIRRVRHDVFADDELIPTFFNMFHWLTKPSVIRDELLFRKGEPYDPKQAEETERILRSLGIFSLVRVVPVRTEEADAVGVLVYTRDLWSLRLEQRLQFTGAQIDSLTVALTERNLFGRNKRVSTRFNLLPLYYSVGQVYYDRRLLGQPLQLTESFDVFFNRETDQADGALGSLTLEKPLYDLGTPWAYGGSLTFDYRVIRQASGSRILETEEGLRRVWDQRYLAGQGWVTAQRGEAHKHRLRAGAGYRRYRAAPNAETELGSGEEEAFRAEVLPGPYTHVYPFVSYAGFEPSYRTYENLASFGQSEDVRVGPQWGAALSSPLKLLGSSEDRVNGSVFAGWVVPYAYDGVAEAAVAVEASLLEGEPHDQLVYTRLRGATPMGVVRLVARADWFARPGDLNRQLLVTLGGDNGLRGYPADAFFAFGEDLFRSNVELRTRPWEWMSVHLGGVLFYDAGSLHPRWAEADLKQTVGVGLRGLLPQFSRYAYRLDFGVPVDGSGFMVTLQGLSGGSGQALPLTPGEDELFESSVAGLSVQP